MRKLLSILAAFCLLAGCNDFVDVVPKGNTIPETVDDLGKMMADGGMSMTNPMASFSYCVNFIEAYSDDYTASETPGSAMYDVHKNTSMYANVLTWADYIYTVAEDDYNWSGLYKSNYVTNYVLANIDRVENGVDYDRNEVKGQALVHRAMNYFLLVNLYGKQYNAATADTDLGVPLILAPDINNSYPRETVGKIYGQLLSDLGEALELLVKREIEPLHILFVEAVVPLTVGRPQDIAHLFRGQGLVKAQPVKDHPDLFFQFGRVGEVPAPERRAPRVGADEPQRRLDGGALAGAVLADQPHDAALRHRKGHMVQCEAVVLLGQVFDLQDRIHGHSSS